VQRKLRKQGWSFRLHKGDWGNALTGEQMHKLVVFQSKEIRRLWHEAEWYYSLADVFGALTRSERHG